MKLSNSFVVSLAIAFAPLSVAQSCPAGVKPFTTGKQCPCVTVDADCTVIDPRPEYASLRGESCGALNVEADSNGNYPDVKVKYSYSMCNYNRFDIRMKNEAKFYDWTKKRGDKAKNVADPRVPLGGLTLKSNDCETYDEEFFLSTANRYNIATQLEGFVLDTSGNAKDPQFGKCVIFMKGQNPTSQSSYLTMYGMIFYVNTDYCYAYVSKAINIKRGLCKMSTNASCTVVETGQDCQEFVDQNPGPCKNFNAKFEWEACNGEPRFMEVMSEPSNVKIARKVNGQMQNTRINRVGNLGPVGSSTACQKFGPEYRSYSTCSDEGNVFFSINVQGTKPNGNYWYECQDFTFQKVVFNPLPITAAPTAGPTNNPTRTPTKNPTGGPTSSPTRNPTSAPTMTPPKPAPSKGKGGKGKGRSLNADRRRRARKL